MKGNTMKDKISMISFMIFVFSMFFAAGAIEENQFFMGAMLVLTGILTGTLTAILQK